MSADPKLVDKYDELMAFFIPAAAPDPAEQPDPNMQRDPDENLLDVEDDEVLLFLKMFSIYFVTQSL
jgi:hypothetical protein